MMRLKSIYTTLGRRLYCCVVTTCYNQQHSNTYMQARLTLVIGGTVRGKGVKVIPVRAYSLV